MGCTSSSERAVAPAEMVPDDRKVFKAAPGDAGGVEAEEEDNGAGVRMEGGRHGGRESPMSVLQSGAADSESEGEERGSPTPEPVVLPPPMAGSVVARMWGPSLAGILADMPYQQLITLIKSELDRGVQVRVTRVMQDGKHNIEIVFTDEDGSERKTAGSWDAN